MGSYADIAPAFKEGSMYSIVDAGYGSKADFAAVNVTGKVALVERGPIGTGAIYFRDKVLNAQAAGAAGVIIYNHSPGVISMTLRVAAGDETRNYIPCIGITQDAGLDLKMLTTRGLVVRFGTRSDLGTLADFSSMGPTEDFHFKPEVSAPGVTVNSTFLGGEYARLDGTSVASPGVAGAVALIKAAHSDWTPQTVKLALMNTVQCPSELAEQRSHHVDTAGSRTRRRTSRHRHSSRGGDSHIRRNDDVSDRGRSCRR